MKIIVNHIELKPELISFGEWRIGWHLKRGAPSVPYILIVDRQDFMLRFSPDYEKCIKELKDDEAMTGEFASPYEGATTYPTLEEFLKLPEVDRVDMTTTFFERSILKAYIRPDSDSDNILWLLQDIDSFSVEGNTLRIGGRAVDSEWKYSP